MTHTGDPRASSDDRYTHGHDAAVLSSHRWRTAENSARYLLGHLEEDAAVLDVGCGPGNLTADLARHVPRGHVLGVDRAPEAVAIARRDFPESPSCPVTFEVGDAYALSQRDASVDVVHAHQVLQHLSRPVDALGEWRRVLRPGGLVAVRDVDYATMVFGPADPVLAEWNACYHAVTAANGATADAGRMLPTWVHDAGFADLCVTSSTWTFTSEADRAWWGSLWASRVSTGTFATQALEGGHAAAADLQRFAEAFHRFSESPSGICVMVHVEVVARRA